MRQIALKCIEDASFRANPEYELLLFDRLSPADKEVLRDLQKDPDHYGILRPRERSALGIKSVDRDTALLCFTLRQPGRLPTYIKATLGDRCNQVIAQLVLDGVLEIEHDTEFVHGADAYELVYEDAPAPTDQGAIARLSMQALKYAQALEIGDSLRLSARMYFYNRQPVSPEWKRIWPSPDSVAMHLGIHAGGSNKLLLDQAWTPVKLPPPHDVWYMWSSRHMHHAPEEATFTYKLYVSPRCEYVRDAFQAAVDIFSRLDVANFKIGKDVYGLLRPDKLVAYFWSLNQLQEAAEQLRRTLDGCPAHGVPFTAEIAGEGLLSWGVDPPREKQLLSWQDRESWRLWLTNRLATAMLAAKAARSRAVEPWQFAIERLRFEGVDTDSWTPTKTIWHEQPTPEV